jgi:hypothetical protein
MEQSRGIAVFLRCSLTSAALALAAGSEFPLPRSFAGAGIVFFNRAGAPALIDSGHFFRRENQRRHFFSGL